MGFCGLGLSDVLRILQIVFCVLALLIPMFRGKMINPYAVWCEFVWVFGMVVAVVILVLEKWLLVVILQVYLQHSWDDLKCGLLMLCTLMLLSASIIYAVVFVGSFCFGDIISAIFSFLALIVYAVDAVKSKLKCPEGYLSNGRGILRFSQCWVACIILAAATSAFLGVEQMHHMLPLMWCMLVYSVCLLVSAVIILAHLLKPLNALCCCALDKLEVIINVVAVVLYSSAAVLWILYAYRYYRWTRWWDIWHNRRLNDVNVVSVLTLVNLCLYIADLIWFPLALYKRI
ncbi:myeloid-associated differentiation marker-like protein 2 [Chanos chanos]|uniref:Myeloid-associated differentiation marker-like protein 2 n=1 Tax=Chanos chanos TaxID=29144 RepID=A0A6J2V2T0_CHACN|nr:myeloid-associated differentiation marker-like protein 2 [Chanos chanos]